jgi:hypothetical protein
MPPDLATATRTGYQWFQCDGSDDVQMCISQIVLPSVMMSIASAYPRSDRQIFIVQFGGHFSIAFCECANASRPYLSRSRDVKIEQRIAFRY